MSEEYGTPEGRIIEQLNKIALILLDIHKDIIQIKKLLEKEK